VQILVEVATIQRKTISQMFNFEDWRDESFLDNCSSSRVSRS